MNPANEDIFKQPSAPQQEREDDHGKRRPEPQAHETNPGKTGHKATQTDGSPVIVETDTQGLGPRDDAPGILRRKDGPGH